jgi:hypothetical protein
MATKQQPYDELKAYKLFENKQFINQEEETVTVCKFCYENNGCYCFAAEHIEISKQEYDSLF